MTIISVSVLDTMNSYEFKDFVVTLFKGLGYSNIKVGSETAIRGVDMTMEKATDIGTVKYLVQCEHQPLGVVALPVVKILHSTVVSTPALDKGLIVTSGRFSSEAIEYAEEIGIELIDAWKLIELGKKVGLTIQKKPSHQIESCFPISNKSQITIRLLGFLRNDLKGFEEKLANIEDMGLRLVPSYMVDYSINATFSTSVGVIHSINESSSIFLTDRGEPIHEIITDALLPQKYRISTVTPDTLGNVKILEKGEFTKPFKEIKSTAKDVLARAYTQTVSYYGANNRRYEKTCIPKQKDISISDVKQVYIPSWNIMFSVLKNKYAIVGIENTSGLTVLPSNMVSVKANSGVKVPVNKLFIEQPSPEPKVKVMIPMYEPLEISKCKKCGRIIAEPKELIRIVKHGEAN